MRNVFRLTYAVLLTLGAWAAADPARGSEIVYVGADGNVWSAPPQPGVPRQITRDASPATPYRDPTLGDDGTVAIVQDRKLLFLDRDGTPRRQPSAASTGGSDSSSPPLGLDLSSQGESVLYWYMYDPPGTAASYARITSLVPGFAGSECFMPAPCHDGFAVPKWIPGTRDFGLIDVADGSLHVLTRSGDHRWLSFTGGAVFLDYDVSRSGFRLLAEVAASFSEPTPSALLYWENHVAPPDFPDQQRYCFLGDFATGMADVSWSPDGTAFTWAGQDGIYVSPAPVISEEGCELRPRLLVSGGTQPDWGEVTAGNPVQEPSPSPAPVSASGRPSPPPQPIAGATVHGLRVRPAAFRASRTGTSIGASGGARVSYRASAATTTRFKVERIARGVKRGGACMRPAKDARVRRCTRYVSVSGSWTHAASRGVNGFRFTGRVGGRALRAGAYRMTAAELDGAAAPSTAARTLFAIR